MQLPSLCQKPHRLPWLVISKNAAEFIFSNGRRGCSRGAAVMLRTSRGYLRGVAFKAWQRGSELNTDSSSEVPSSELNSHTQLSATMA